MCQLTIYQGASDQNILDWSEDAYVSIPGLLYNRNTINAGTLEVPQVDAIENISPDTPNLFIVARGVSDGVFVGTFKLKNGDSKELGT